MRVIHVALEFRRVVVGRRGGYGRARAAGRIAGRIVVTGRVVDYTGASLVLEASGQKQTIPGKQVVEVRSTCTAEQTAGDDLWRRRDYAAAQAKYAAAMSAEQRPGGNVCSAASSSPRCASKIAGNSRRKSSCDWCKPTRRRRTST
ncbi:MAG: hypothetical protein QM775_11470 [Pirellulales bacterium]